MKLDITKEWFEKHSTLEGDLEIGAGLRFPPAYGGCTCSCHHSYMIHIVACCNPSKSDFECMSSDVRAYLEGEPE